MEINTEEECLKALSKIINFLDKKQIYGIGDKVFEIINELKNKWNMED